MVFAHFSKTLHMKKILFVICLFVIKQSNSQTFSLTSPQSFTIGCSSKSVCNVYVMPIPTSTSTVFNYSLAGPSPSSSIVSGTITPQTALIFNAPGTYSLKLNSGTITINQIQFSILQHTLGPSIGAITPKQLLDCYTPSVSISGVSESPTTSVAWLSSQGTGTFSNPIQINSNTTAPNNTLTGTYTLVITDLDNLCKSTSVIPIYQDIATPTITIPSIFNCPNPTITLNASAIASNTIIQYFWSSPLNAIISGSNTASLTTNTGGSYSLTVKDVINGCKSTAQVSVSSCTGLMESRNLEPIRVSPNPSNGKFQISNIVVQANSVIEVYNSLGSLISVKQITNREELLDLQQEVEGFYYLTYKVNNKTIQNLKLLKN